MTRTFPNRPGHDHGGNRLATRGGQAGRRAFTLMELLTVIAIIAVLAALAVPLAGGAKTARTRSRTQAELRQIQTAIESYKADRGVYPPDHADPTPANPRRVNPAVNPLFYELRGMDLVNGQFRCKGDAHTYSPDDLFRAFGRRGILNTSADRSEPARSHFDPKADMVKRVTYNGVEIEVLATASPWPRGEMASAPISGSTVNPWRYVSTSPTNNTGSFDLWAEVHVGKEKQLFHNW